MRTFRFHSARVQGASVCSDRGSNRHLLIAEIFCATLLVAGVSPDPLRAHASGFPRQVLDSGAGLPEEPDSPTRPNRLQAEPTQPETEETPPLPGTGETVWAVGFEGQLVWGVDGEIYPAYNLWTIEHVQTLLLQRGLYSGPVNGVLDMPTMKAIAAFQEASQILQVCGVPTPKTRRLLEQGSHTPS